MTAQRITIAGRDYDVSCDDGQEAHLKALARNLDGRARKLSEAMGKPGEAQLLMLCALMLTDELQDAQKAQEELRHDIHHSSQSFETNKQIELENIITTTIHDIATRIEAIAVELERV